MGQGDRCYVSGFRVGLRGYAVVRGTAPPTVLIEVSPAAIGTALGDPVGYRTADGG